MTQNNSGPISHPQDHRSNLLLMLSIMLISLVLGGGIVWVFCDYQYKNVTARLENAILKSKACESQIDLYRNIDAILHDIVLLTGKYQKELSANNKDTSIIPPDKLMHLQQKLVHLKQKYQSNEEKLAKVENRDIRFIDLSF